MFLPSLKMPNCGQAFNQEKAGLIPSPNMLGLTAAYCGYEEGQAWHQRYCVLNNNRDF